MRPQISSSMAFSCSELRLVDAASRRAANLVSDYYRVAPREWQRMPYEVRTLRSLASDEVTDRALAQTLCYQFKKQVGETVIEQGDLYRICLQDHKILEAADRHSPNNRGFTALLTYIVTHELVHVVRFGQQLQRIDLPFEMRQEEEKKVESTTRAILTTARDRAFQRLLSEAIF